ncbi:unnamed protein product [Leptidea sinapis]|uniref:Uncharacterized protein n=1 Tax=Leptidea sinapis TaxID=189913 RepID=A0A5E4Q7U9_9NEOP|nr:unnamed protein product [Leptidea sinapis]
MSQRINTLLLGLFLIKTVECTKAGPDFHINETTSCEEFSKFARFNPDSVLLSKWIAFYYWGPTQPFLTITYAIPTHERDSPMRKLTIPQPISDMEHGDILEAIDIRFKQVANGRYIGLMVCNTTRVYLLARKKHIPPKKDIQVEAARLGFKGRGGDELTSTHRKSSTHVNELRWMDG